MPASPRETVPTTVDTEVAVVGGGPVGMLVARELALLGVGTTVYEKLPTPSPVSKASTLHARTAQLLHRRGILDAVQPGPPPGGTNGAGSASTSVRCSTWTCPGWSTRARP